MEGLLINLSRKTEDGDRHGVAHATGVSRGLAVKEPGKPFPGVQTIAFLPVAKVDSSA
jgi:hypothetical protein